VKAHRKWIIYAALAPAIAVAVIAYIGTMVWTIWISFTNARLLPNGAFVGLSQYQRLAFDLKWQVASTNLAIYCVLFIAASMILGFLLAVALDLKVRAEGVFRTMYLFPQGMSFVITGLVWQWIMNPTLGLQRFVNSIGLEGLRVDWIVRQDAAIYVLVMAGTWQASGLVMALMLAGLRGIDPQLWKAAQVDGIPKWRYYVNIALPELRAMVVTAVILLALVGVKVYELVVAMTNGGPGIATEVPTKFIMEYFFERTNVGLATAAATLMLITVAAIAVPFVYVQYFRNAARPQ
jgi:glucose/mannose transport system permease protein